jgi:hypothetical protein
LILNGKPEEGIEWYIGLDIVMLDESDLVMFEGHKLFSVWMDAWQQKGTQVICLTATVTTKSHSIEYKLRDEIWKFKQIEFDPRDANKNTGPDLQIEHVPVDPAKFWEELEEYRANQQSPILVYCSDLQWMEFENAALA